MKNIRIYTAPKYKSDLYEEVESNIYKTYVVHENSHCLSLKSIANKEKIEILNSLDSWKVNDDNFGEKYYVIVHEGKKYYKEIDDVQYIYVNANDDSQPELSYVTSIMFEQEPKYGENEPSDSYVSQYPLEDILEEFNCELLDFYEDENTLDSLNSYIEFASSDIDDIKNILSIIGKHVYNKEDGDYVKLIIE